ncbi:hypothetical protein TNCT_188371 [Trichonephila clavata]|uniref:Uncharacterized protein n=1 Tax=Trichonephila clavata TaxID=2740835 RepID=A0A8X6LGB5_TRICU|nr:hypothetical protein TNCT_188371 [Trichonephila clavata]
MNCRRKVHRSRLGISPETLSPGMRNDRLGSFFIVEWRRFMFVENLHDSSLWECSESTILSEMEWIFRNEFGMLCCLGNGNGCEMEKGSNRNRWIFHCIRFG